MCLQPLLSVFIVNLLLWQLMVSSIYFNNQFSRNTTKICNIFTNDMLTSEWLSELSLLQKIPENRFCLRWSFSVLFGKVFQ